MVLKKETILRQNYETVLKSEETETTLQSLQVISQLSVLLDEKKFKAILVKFANHPSPAIAGELCYLIGRRGKLDAISYLLNYLKKGDEYVHTQAVEALSQLRGKMDEQAEEELFIEEKAYMAMEEELLVKYPGQFAGFYKGELVAVKPDKIELMRAVEGKFGHVRYYIRLISRELPEIRLPEPRNPRKQEWDKTR